MSDFEKSMEQIFDIVPEIKKEKIQQVIPHRKKKDDDSDLKQDLTDAYEQSKENLQDIIEQGKDAMDEILQIAKAGQHPRAFEVYGTLLKNMVEANRELLAIQKQMREMDQKKETTNTNIDKAIFIGSTTELGKLLKNNKNSE